MTESVANVSRQAHEDYPVTKRSEWALKWPGMVVLAIDQIFWTRETEAAISERGLRGTKEYEAQCTAQLNDVVQLVRSKLTKLQRSTLGAMVTLDVHGRDVLTTMVEAGVDQLNDFNWIAQLRYYYEPETSPDIDVCMITAKSRYGFEYLGNSFRLVVTPLTDRCDLGRISADLGCISATRSASSSRRSPTGAISAASRLISAASRRHLGGISAVSRRHLGRISGASRRHLGRHLTRSCLGVAGATAR